MAYCSENSAKRWYQYYHQLLGQPIRLMLAYSETPFVDKQYACGPGPDYDRSDWLKEKYTLGLDFPNLPYYIEGNVKMTQSVSIMRYLARKHKLDPETEEDRMRADMVEQQMVDMINAYVKLINNPEFEKLRNEYVKGLSGGLELLSKFLGKGNWFASQDKLTYVDFMVYEQLDHYKILAPECLDDYQNLKDFMQRFEELPSIQKYMQSNGFLKFPLNGDSDYFGSRRTTK